MEKALFHSVGTFESSVKNFHIYSELFNGVCKNSFHTQESSYCGIALIAWYPAMRDG